MCVCVCVSVCVCVCFLCAQSLDGFVFVVSHEGRFLYISETVSIYLGLSQVRRPYCTPALAHTQIHTGTHARTRAHTGIILCIQVHLHTCAYLLLTLSYPLPGVSVCVFVSVNIFDCTLCAHLWSATLSGAMLLSLYLSLPPLSPSPGAHLC